MKSITVVAEDKVGLLADISYVLAKTKINIESVNVDVISANAVINLGVRDPKKAKETLEAAGYKVETAPVVIRIRKENADGIFEEIKKKGVKATDKKLLCEDDEFQVYSMEVDKKKKANEILAQFLITHDSDF